LLKFFLFLINLKKRQILTGSSPFKCKKVAELKDIVIIQKKRPGRDTLFEACGEELVKSVWDLLTEMWQEDPEKR
jgi:hypothetical protein